MSIEAETPNPSSTPETDLVEALRAFTENAVMDEYTHRVSVDEWVLSKARGALSNVLPDEEK